jgi:hypothetical protein
MLTCKCCLPYTSKDTHNFRFQILVRSCIRKLRLFYGICGGNKGKKITVRRAWSHSLGGTGSSDCT